MSRAGWLLPLLLAGCPWVRDLTVPTAPRFRPGEPVELRATFRLGPTQAPLRGRAHLAIRLPLGWGASGQYRLGRRVFSLQAAPLLARRYHRRAGGRWLAFVSFLHTEIPRGTKVALVLTLLPPRDAPRRPVRLSVAAGVAPSYDGWERLDGPRRRILLLPAAPPGAEP